MFGSSQYRCIAQFMVFCLVASGAARAEQVELFNVVNSETYDRAVAHNPRFIAEKLYFSSRHWLVEVNAESLVSQQEVLLNVADDVESFTLKRADLRVKRGGTSFTWQGHIMFPSRTAPKEAWSEETLSQLEAQGLSFEQFIDMIGQTRLHVLYWDVAPTGIAILAAKSHASDSRSGDEPVSVSGSTSAMGPSVAQQQGTDRLRMTTRNAFAAVRGEFNLQPVGAGVFRLEPLPYSPRYHLLYEVDQSRDFLIMDEEPTGEVLRRKQQYDRHMESVPEAQTRPVRGEF